MTITKVLEAVAVGVPVVMIIWWNIVSFMNPSMTERELLIMYWKPYGAGTVITLFLYWFLYERKQKKAE